MSLAVTMSSSMPSAGIFADGALTESTAVTCGSDSMSSSTVSAVVVVLVVLPSMVSDTGFPER